MLLVLNGCCHCRIDQFNNALNGFLRSKALLQAT
jgi:hypothetical protein